MPAGSMSAFASIPIDLTGRVDEPGDSYPVSGHVDATAYTVGEKEYRLAEGVSFDVVFTNAGDGILVTGMVRGTATGECDRCLDPASFEIAGEIEDYYLFQEPDDPEAYEDGFELVGEDRIIDLAGPVSDAVVMDTPFVLLCRPDCKGLCPICGCNRNREVCDCAERRAEEDAAAASNPFAALKDLKLE